MYYAHFGLKEPPFKITPNTEFFFSGGNRGAVLDALIYAINSGEGIIKVVGEVGSGKTMLCRMLQTLLPEKVETVYLANPSVAPEDVLHAIAFELQLKLTKNADRLQVMQVLQKYLVDRHAQGKQVVIFVEEAQGMPIATLEEIRLLSNLETKHDKLLQIVLFGQPELDVNLNQNQIRQLRERITHSFYLGPLDQASIDEYLIFRLRSAGYFGPHLFSKSAVKLLSKAAEGLVRRVNILADKALLATFAANAYQVTPKHVRAAIKDSEFGANFYQRAKHRWLIALAVVLIVVVLAAFFFVQFKTNNKPVSQPAAVENQIPQAKVELPQQAVNAAVATIEPQKAVETSQPAPTAADPSDILDSRLVATLDWLKQQPESTVSIQIMGGTSDEQLRTHLQLLSTQLELDNIYVFRTKVSNRPFLTVLYGSYPNREEAQRAIQKLPLALKINHPQLRTVGGILKETKQFQ
ncbi:MAG: AAA family ATPase [Methylophilaceae bacterium]|nr:AAA family ATPase [Methyloradius sp.]